MTEISNYEIIFDYAPFLIEEGKIREFAKAIGSTNPIYVDAGIAKEKGHRAIPAPPTFATVIDFWNERDFYQLFQQIGLDPNHVLHGEQEYEYVQTLFAGDVIRARAIVKERIEKKSMTFFKLETVYKNQRDEVVLVNRSTLIERAAASE